MNYNLFIQLQNNVLTNGDSLDGLADNFGIKVKLDKAEFTNENHPPKLRGSSVDNLSQKSDNSSCRRSFYLETDF